MNKEELIKAVNEGAMFTEEGDRVLYEQQVIDLIEQSLSGHVIVPEEPNFPRFNLRVQAVIDHLEPPHNTGEKAKRDQQRIYLDGLVTRLMPQFKEIIYKAMLSAAKGE